MAGPGIRYHRLATELAGRFDVTLVAPGKGSRTRRTRSVRPSRCGLRRDLRGGRRRGAEPAARPRSAASGGPASRLVFDLYAPALVEAAANLAERPSGDRSRRHPLRGGRRDDAGRAPARGRVPLRQRTAARPLAGRARRAGPAVARGLRGRPGSALARRRRAVRPRSGPSRLDRPRVKGVLPGIGRPIGSCSGAEGSGTGSIPLTVIRAVGRLAEAPDGRQAAVSRDDAPEQRRRRDEHGGSRPCALADGARARRDVRSSSTARGSRTTSASPGSPRPTSGSARTATRSRRGWRSARGCSTTSPAGRRSVVTARRRPRRPRRGEGHGPRRRSGRRRRLGGGAGRAARRRSRVRGGAARRSSPPRRSCRGRGSESRSRS